MQSFAGDGRILDLVPGKLTRLLSSADVGRGLEELHVAQMPSLLGQLATRARVQSIKASSALEGVVVPDEQRADRIIGRGASQLRGRSEQELAGYRDAVDYIWQADWRPVNTGLVLHLHRLLLGHTAVGGGAFKTEDNLVVDRTPQGDEIRFHPVSARETPWSTEELIARYTAARVADEHHPLLLIGLAVLDLLVIHPFEDGNGRVARVLTSALLADAGYGVGRYVSLEQLIADAPDGYYDSLLASTHHWHEGEHDPWPWLTYFIGRIGVAYAIFGQRAAADGTDGGGKRERVKRYVLEQAPTRFRIADVRTSLPGVSDGTIRNAFSDLRREGRIVSDGTGRGAVRTRLPF